MDPLIESEQLELKLEVTETLLKTVVAFANGSGGTILIGVADDGQIIGLAKPDRDLERVVHMIQNNIRPDIIPYVSCKLKNIDEKTLIEITVKTGSARPYYLRKKGLTPEGVFHRIGSATYSTSHEYIYDLVIANHGASFEDHESVVQDLTFNQAAAIFADHGFELGVDQQKSLHFINESQQYTNLALLCSDQCPYSIKLGVFAGSGVTEFRDRREFTGSVLQQFVQLTDFLKQHNPFITKIDYQQRHDIHDYPPVAVRETIVNAIIHRDYNIRGDCTVVLNQEQLMVTSLGGLVQPLTVADLYRPVSLSRNPRLTQIFYRLRFAEAYGTGISRIMQEYLDQKSKPVFDVSPGVFSVILPNRNIQTRNIDLDESSQQIYQALIVHQSATRVFLEELTGLSTSTVNRALRTLQEKNLVVAVGQGRKRRYRRLV